MTQEPLVISGVNLWAIAPEMVMVAGAMGILVLGAGFKKSHPLILMAGALTTLLGAAIAAILALGQGSGFAFDGTIAMDGFAGFLKLVLIASAGVSVLAGYDYIQRERAAAPEYLGLLMLATTGMMLMAAAADLITVFLALETFSLALYVMAAFRRQRLDSQEGSFKYFLSGSFASAFFLYGVALTYGGTGTTRLEGIATSLAEGLKPGTEVLVFSGLALLLVGLAFKVAAVPFHMWTPDVYQGAPAPVTGFMAAGSKVAGFAVLLRALYTGFHELVTDWQPILIALAVVTMIFGSVVAVAQTNVKRMLAYSSIAHSGFLLVGVIAANQRGLSGALFYLGSYSFVIVGSFAVIYAVGRAGESRVELSDYRGLWNRQPFMAVALAVMLVSLAGVPPTAGFWAKLEVFLAAVEAGQVPLVVAALLSSVVAVFFYLRVIVMMFLQEEEWTKEVPDTGATSGLAAAIGLAVVAVLGVYPTPLLDFARQASLVLFR